MILFFDPSCPLLPKCRDTGWGMQAAEAELAEEMALGLEGETDAKRAAASRNAASGGHLLHALAKASFQLVRKCPGTAACPTSGCFRGPPCCRPPACPLPPPSFPSHLPPSSRRLAHVSVLHPTRRGDGDAKLVSNGGPAARGAAQAPAPPGTLCTASLRGCTRALVLEPALMPPARWSQWRARLADGSPGSWSCR